MKWFKVFYFVLFVLVFSYIFAGEFILAPDSPRFDDYLYDYSQGWSYELEDGTAGAITVPGRCEAKPGELVCFTNVIPRELDKRVNVLTYLSARQDVEVYIGDELRTAYSTKSTRLFDINSAYATVIVPVSAADAGKNITIRAVTDSVSSGNILEIYLGNQIGVLLKYMEKEITMLMTALFTIIVSLICIVIGITLDIIYKKEFAMGYLGCGVFIASLWVVANSYIRQFIFSSLSVVGDVAFLLIMLMPFPFLAYMNNIQKDRYRRLYVVLGCVAVINMVVNSALHITGVIDFSRSIAMSAVMCVTVLSSFIYTIVNDVIHKRIRDYFLFSMGLAFTFICAFVQVIVYFTDNESFNGTVITVGLVILLIVAAADTFINLIRNENHKKAMLMAGEAKSQFLVNMSHEIRTPINAVMGMNEMILRESKDEVIREYATDIQAAGHSLLSIINDILDMSKIEQGKMELVIGEYSLAALVRNVTNMVKSKAEGKGLTLNINLDASLPEKLIGDEVRINQILTNICNNAVKYTEKGSVTVDITGEVTGDIARLMFSVADTGIGIKKEDMPRLFAAFQRIEESRNRNIEGTGLGMSITTQLLQLMNSKLEVASEYGKGSRFWFVIEQPVVSHEPVGEIDKHIRPKQAEVKEQSFFTAPEARVLVVDDNRMNIKVLKSLLKKSEMTIDEAESGYKCLELVRENHYDIIFLDHMMPEMDGIETLKNMRQLEDMVNPNVKVVALTANAVMGAREMYLSEGFDDYMSKPVVPAVLEELLKRYLE